MNSLFLIEMYDGNKYQVRLEHNPDNVEIGDLITQIGMSVVLKANFIFSMHGHVYKNRYPHETLDQFIERLSPFKNSPLVSKETLKEIYSPGTPF